MVSKRTITLQTRNDAASPKGHLMLGMSYGREKVGSAWVLSTIPSHVFQAHKKWSKDKCTMLTWSCWEEDWQQCCSWSQMGAYLSVWSPHLHLLRCCCVPWHRSYVQRCKFACPSCQWALLQRFYSQCLPAPKIQTKILFPNCPV